MHSSQPAERSLFQTSAYRFMFDGEQSTSVHTPPLYRYVPSAGTT